MILGVLVSDKKIPSLSNKSLRL